MVDGLLAFSICETWRGVACRPLKNGGVKNVALRLAAGKGEVQRQESGEYVFVLRLTYSWHAELIPFIILKYGEAIN